MTDHYGYSDLPAANDELGFAPSAEALAAIMQGGQLADTPLTVGVYGEWGSGKTTLMRMILDRLDHGHSVAVWFDAWRYAQQDALWRALLLSVVEALRDQLEHTELLTAYIDRNKRIAGTAMREAAGEQELDATREQLKRRLDDLADSSAEGFAALRTGALSQAIMHTFPSEAA